MLLLDYVKTGVSYVVAALANVSTFIWYLNPYLIILGAFAEFVFWNGGVVLGTHKFHISPTRGTHVSQVTRRIMLHQCILHR